MDILNISFFFFAAVFFFFLSLFYFLCSVSIITLDIFYILHVCVLALFQFSFFCLVFPFSVDTHSPLDFSSCYILLLLFTNMEGLFWCLFTFKWVNYRANIAPVDRFRRRRWYIKGRAGTKRRGSAELCPRVNVYYSLSSIYIRIRSMFIYYT